MLGHLLRRLQEHDELTSSRAVPSQRQTSLGSPSLPNPIDPTKSITFVVTEECNLRCKYCYLVHKNPDHRMSFEVARAAIDYLLENRALVPEPKASWEFIGGEPFLELPLLDQIVDYVRLRSYELDHPWFIGSRYTITTNGVLYGSPAAQAFIGKHRDVLDITISVDGPEHVHDRARLTKDGGGSYAQVVKNVPLWLEQFPGASTKVTINRDNLPFVAESILHLFDLGIRDIHANVVFEDVWLEGDDARFEGQLDALADAMVRRGLWRIHTCSLFRRDIGTPLDARRDDGNWCGTGRMLAIDSYGNFYPCNRFLPFSLAKRAPRAIGDIRRGLDSNRIRPFLALTRTSQSSKECSACEVARGCSWCQGLNYDDAATPTIYQRAIHLCAMHKARVRSNRRFWERVDATADEENT